MDDFAWGALMIMSGQGHFGWNFVCNRSKSEEYVYNSMKDVTNSISNCELMRADDGYIEMSDTKMATWAKIIEEHAIV